MQAGSEQDSDRQIDFRGILSGFWRDKAWIVGVTMAFSAAGVAYAFLTHPVYYAEAIIAPKSSGADARQGVLSQFGGLGFMASQLGLGNTNLDHLEVILKSKGLAEKVIVENALLPRLFPTDSLAGNRKRRSVEPGLRDGIELLTNRMLKVKADSKKQVLMVGVEARDSGFSTELVEMYLTAFNQKLQSDIRSDADSNKKYLETQLTEVTDPLLREKIQNLMAGQMEKAMLMNSSSFDVLEKPFVPTVPSKPRKAMVILFALFSGLVGSCLSLLLVQAAKGGASPSRARERAVQAAMV